MLNCKRTAYFCYRWWIGELFGYEDENATTWKGDGEHWKMANVNGRKERVV